MQYAGIYPTSALYVLLTALLWNYPMVCHLNKVQGLWFEYGNIALC
nr:MAG TPA: hypothetical protein [Caudoviricetes sp.]